MPNLPAPPKKSKNAHRTQQNRRLFHGLTGTARGERGLGLSFCSMRTRAASLQRAGPGSEINEAVSAQHLLRVAVPRLGRRPTGSSLHICCTVRGRCTGRSVPQLMLCITVSSENAACTVDRELCMCVFI